MGFRCPLCFKDFGRDKKAWEDHCKNDHGGAAAIAVKAVFDVVEGEAQQGSGEGQEEE